MKITLGNRDLAIYAVAGLLAVGALWWLSRSVLNINRGTPYEGAGVVGTAGNITNQLLGGAPAAAGSAISRTVYDWFHPSPTDAGTTYYVTFPNGLTGAVNAEDVARDGSFAYRGGYARYAAGTRFRIATVDGKRIAVAL